jgi:hypothetical protein
MLKEAAIRLTHGQRKALSELKSVLYVIGLDPNAAIKRWQSDPSAIRPILRSMLDQVVRSEVLHWYTMTDLILDMALLDHLFGKTRSRSSLRRSRRYKTVQAMCRKLYPRQKLQLVRSFKNVPKPICRSIEAMNELRNGLAHSFFLEDIPASKRTYMGRNVFTVDGLEFFLEDMHRVRYFFEPWLEPLERGLNSEEGT